MVIKTITINVSLSRNFNKVEQSAVIEFNGDEQNIQESIDCIRNSLINDCLDGLNVVTDFSTPKFESFDDIPDTPQTQVRMASESQIKYLKGKGYPGDPYKLTYEQAWTWLHKNK